MRLQRLKGLFSLEGLESLKGLEHLERLGRRSWASGLFLPLKKKTKNRIACRHTFFLLTGRQGHYLAFRFVYLNLITYITMSIIFNKIQ